MEIAAEFHIPIQVPIFVNQSINLEIGRDGLKDTHTTVQVFTVVEGHPLRETLNSSFIKESENGRRINIVQLDILHIYTSSTLKTVV